MQNCQLSWLLTSNYPHLIFSVDNCAHNKIYILELFNFPLSYKKSKSLLPCGSSTLPGIVVTCHLRFQHFCFSRTVLYLNISRIFDAKNKSEDRYLIWSLACRGAVPFDESVSHLNMMQKITAHVLASKHTVHLTQKLICIAGIFNRDVVIPSLPIQGNSTIQPTKIIIEMRYVKKVVFLT